MQSGIFERFQSLPIARSSVLWAHVLTSLVAILVSLVVVMLVAALMGFRSPADALAWLAVAGILILFALALTWIAVIPGLTAKSTDGAGAFAYPLIQEHGGAALGGDLLEPDVSVEPDGAIRSLHLCPGPTISGLAQRVAHAFIEV